MIKSFKIKNFTIKKGGPIFFIAEIGVNFNGNIRLAKKLILEAKKAGAQCVKFQTFEPEILVHKKSPKAAYQLRNTSRKESQIEMLKKNCSNNPVSIIFKLMSKIKFLEEFCTFNIFVVLKKK